MGLNPIIYIIGVAICAAISVVTAFVVVRAEAKKAQTDAELKRDFIKEAIKVANEQTPLMSSPTGDSTISITAVDAIKLTKIAL